MTDDETGSYRQTAPFFAACCALLSLGIGPIGFLLSLAITIYIFVNGTYSLPRRMCAAISCTIALVIATFWTVLLLLRAS